MNARGEYENTNPRDLLGRYVRAAGPSSQWDDSAMASTNIGDVLSLSPLLMEKLLSPLAGFPKLRVYGEPYPPQTGPASDDQAKRSQAIARRSGESYRIRGGANSMVFTISQSLGLYEFRWRYSKPARSEVTDQPEGVRGRRRGRRAGQAEGAKLRAEEARLNRCNFPAFFLFFLEPHRKRFLRSTASRCLHPPR